MGLCERKNPEQSSGQSHKTVFRSVRGRHDFVNLLDSRAGKIHSRVLCFQRPLGRGTKAVGGGRPASPHGKSDSLSKGVGFNKKSYKTEIEFRRNPVRIDWIVFLLYYIPVWGV